MNLTDLIARAHWPAHWPMFALALVAGLGVAAVSRDLGKRLLGAAVAGMASTVALVVLTRNDPALAGGATAAAVLVLSGASLGLALLVLVRERFGGVDAIGLELAETADDRAERAE